MSDVSPWWEQWSPDNVTISDEDVPDSWKVCVIDGVYFGGNAYSGSLGARISSVFVIFFVSTFFTLFPVVASRVKRLRIPRYVYLFARYFGTGVIVATAFIHLLDPAYGEIGGSSCVGMTGHWADYSWCPAIILFTVFTIFLVDLISDVYVQKKFGIKHSHGDPISGAIVREEGNVQFEGNRAELAIPDTSGSNDEKSLTKYDYTSDSSSEVVKSFESQIAAFLILEFGVLFHSVMIGLNPGTTDSEFAVLYPVLVFHQTFEGLGIGARLSAIPFPEGKKWWPYLLCLAYGLTTPICVAIGLGVRHTYDGNSFVVNIVSGVLDAISAGILIYTGLVELLARDFIFDEERTNNVWLLTFMVGCTLLGAGLMALLGKWA
ncbi:ALI_HP2_G0042980.mRNA.1.CDS.1 [Saccharomyces cerevisiae]|nr:ALI_HP2_G0042980.mRNA.1.CDS.1 [Saccharomyces cerevisiae]CAI6642867.1 ALI_HP2_G0042980.mRNA.1.CDS.1 [Saccharomyces cerevisiae]CAI6700462.1 ALI_collapsed_G0018180.mRNA.1.CDS.1 [Saccharomyces cerevisiae]